MEDTIKCIVRLGLEESNQLQQVMLHLQYLDPSNRRHMLAGLKNNAPTNDTTYPVDLCSICALGLNWISNSSFSRNDIPSGKGENSL